MSTKTRGEPASPPRRDSRPRAPSSPPPALRAAAQHVRKTPRAVGDVFSEDPDLLQNEAPQGQ